MAKNIWVKVSYALYEARPSGYDGLQQLEIQGYKFSSKYGTVNDPNEQAVPYYNGWVNDPTNGNDYFVRTIIAISYTRPQPESVRVHNATHPLWYMVKVGDEFFAPPNVPVIGALDGDQNGPGDVDVGPGANFGKIQVSANGDATFNWSTTAFATTSQVFEAAISDGLKAAVVSTLTPLVGSQFIKSVMQANDVNALVTGFAASATGLLGSGITNLETMSPMALKGLSDQLFGETYQSFSTRLMTALSHNGVNSDYGTPIFDALAISANDIHASGGEYDVTMSADRYYRSPGDDFIIVPGRLLGAVSGTGNDVVLLGTGRSSFNDDRGNDLYIARGSENAAVFSESSGQLIVAKIGDVITVSRTTTGEIDKLIGVDRLQFVDQSLAFDLNGIAGQSYRLYQAAFDRTPDKPGLSFWINYQDEGNGDLKKVAASFIHSAEFAQLYGTPSTVSNNSYVALLYQNVLDRAPDAGGYAFWNARMSAGTSRETMLIEFSESLENKTAVAPAINNGIWYDA